MFKLGETAELVFLHIFYLGPQQEVTKNFSKITSFAHT